jgi:hypothetical protein
MAISRPRDCIRGYHAQKGRRGVWVSLALVWGRGVESAVGAGKRWWSQAMCCEVWGWLNLVLLAEMGHARKSCLSDGSARTHLRGART